MSSGIAVSLSDRVALVTGASGGIGESVVRILGRAGARVARLDRVGAVAPAGGMSLECDVSRADHVDRAVRAVCEEFGRLDLVVHSAGITADGVLWKMDDERWHEVLEVNLSSAFYLLRAATPALRVRGGSVVLVTSINGERGKFGQANYAASKAGLIGLAKTAARELGRFSVRVNCVAPGMIETPMTADLPEAARRAATSESVLDRLGTPDDVANAILFLCSDSSQHVTGQTLRVDGGQLIA